MVSSLAAAPFPAVEPQMADLARAEACPNPPSVTVAGTVTTTEWSDCGGGVQVQLVAIAGLGHTWPRRSDYDATAHVLSFFGLGG